MQTQPQHNYNQISMKKRTREPEQQGEASPQVVPPTPDKGKGKLHPNPPKIGVSPNKERNGLKGHKEKQAPAPLTIAGGKGEGTEHAYAKKAQHTFNVEKQQER